MKTVGNLEKIQLLDQEGYEVKGAIFNNVHELWNDKQTQMTLIFDPARVKKGLAVHEAMGHALRRDGRYTLVVKGLEDVNHIAMHKAYQKAFSVSRADTIAPDISSWQLKEPKAKSNDSLKISFPDMLDFMSLNTRIVVLDKKKNVVPGRVGIGSKEKEWEFIPGKPWEEGTYHLLIHARLEDPAGNNLRGLFDHPIGSLAYEGEDETLFMTFTANGD